MSATLISSTSTKVLRVIALCLGVAHIAAASAYWSRSDYAVRVSSVVYCVSLLVFALFPRKHLVRPSTLLIFRAAMILAAATAVLDAADGLRNRAYRSWDTLAVLLVFGGIVVVIAWNAVRTKPSVRPSNNSLERSRER